MRGRSIHSERGASVKRNKLSGIENVLLRLVSFSFNTLFAFSFIFVLMSGSRCMISALRQKVVNGGFISFCCSQDSS